VRTPNVCINIRERGKLVGKREVHNIWVDRGRQYLAEMCAYASFGPDTPERSDRIRYMGVGIGGVQQSMVVPALVETAYPADGDGIRPGFVTNGNEYREDFPFILNPSPPPQYGSIANLERPVRVDGSTNPYSTALAGDRWLVDETFNHFFTTHLTLTEVTVHGIVSGLTSDVVYAPFTLVPLSEAGLFTSEVSPTGTPFSTLVAYVTFDTIPLTTSIEIEFIWSVKF
jgi:hypothetical protein